MMRNKTLTCLVVFSALASGLCAAQIPAIAPSPSITISASNVTMPSSGSVAIPFTLTSVNGFVGSVAVDCIAPTEPAGVKAPFCVNAGPVRAFPLTADETTTGNYAIVAIPLLTEPAARSANPFKHDQGASWALAGVLILGLGLQRKRTRRFARVLVAIGVIGLTGLSISGCGGPPTLTPGAYVFTLNATSVTTPTLTASTTATVTVPAGIVTNSSN